MATEKNIQIKHFNGVDWDSLFPKTKASITLMDDDTTVQEKIVELINSIATKATQSDINTAISNLVDSAPETLDTLKELANALGNDPNFATTIANQLGNKADKSEVYTKLEVNNQLANKVDKISGKQLSTEDFTTDLKNKLNNLPSDVYSKTEVDNKITASRAGIVVSPTEPTDADYWFEEI